MGRGARSCARLCFKSGNICICRAKPDGRSRLIARPTVGPVTVCRRLSGVTPGAMRPRLDPEIVELFPGAELCREPTRLLAATGPGLAGFGGVSVFRKHLGVGASRMVQLLGAGPVILAELVQPLLEPGFFHDDL